jgi:ABC-type branched-subunit amino acid transport system substrate-binding protein
LVRFSGGRFDLFDQRNSGLAGDLVFDVAAKDGLVWAATNGGISCFDPSESRWELYFEQRADKPQTVFATLCLDPIGTEYLYAGEWCGPVWRLNTTQDSWTQVKGPRRQQVADSASQEGPDDVTLAIATAGRSVWCLALDGLRRRERRSGNWEVQSFGKPMTRNDMAYCLAARSDSEAWLGTEAGLRVIQDWATGTWVTYSRQQHGDGGVVTVSRHGRALGSRALASCIPGNQVRCIAFQGSDVWVGTTAGLALGTGLTDWEDLQSDSGEDVAGAIAAGDRSTPASIMRPAAKGNSGEPGPVPIAAIAPMAKLIGLPGTGPQLSNSRTFTDRFVLLLAVKQANERGGYREGAPFELVAYPRGYDRYGWGAPEDGFPAQVYGDRVSGIVARLSPGSRITSISALHTEAPVVNSAGTRATIDELINPWVFRCRAVDPHQHELLFDYIVDVLGCRRVAVLRSQGGLAQVHLDWWSRHAHRRGLPPVADLFLNPSARSLEPQLRALRQARPDAVLTWCDAETSAGMLRLLREEKITPLFVGSDQMVSDEFVELAGEYPGVVLAIYPCDHRRDRAAAAEFIESYERQRSSVVAKRRVSAEARFTFEATNHLLEAIKVAGRDHQAIRQVLSTMSDAAVARLENGEWKQHRWSVLGLGPPGQAARQASPEGPPRSTPGLQGKAARKKLQEPAPAG